MFLSGALSFYIVYVVHVFDPSYSANMSDCMVAYFQVCFQLPDYCAHVVSWCFIMFSFFPSHMYTAFSKMCHWSSIDHSLLLICFEIGRCFFWMILNFCMPRRLVLHCICIAHVLLVRVLVVVFYILYICYIWKRNNKFIVDFCTSLIYIYTPQKSKAKTT